MSYKHSVLVMVLLTYGCSSEMENDRRPTPAGQSNPQQGQNQIPQNQQTQGGNGQGDFTQPGSGGTGTGSSNHNFTATTSGPIDTSGQAAVPILGSVNFSLKASAQVSVAGRESQGTIALNAQIQSFSPALARSLADNIISSYRDPLTLTYATGQERAAIFSQPAWQGLECIVLPVTAIRNSSYEYRYDPPIPFLVNGNASSQALAAIGSRQFPNINAQIIRHPTAAAGSHQGAAMMSVSGNTLTVTFDFGGVAPRANATPIKSVAYSLDGNGGYSSTKLSAFVSDNSLIDLKVGN